MSGSEGELREAPGAGRVFRLQARLMARTHWMAATVFAAVLGLGTGLLVYGWPADEVGPLTLAHLGVRSHGFVQLVAVFWAVMVTWRGEGPGERFLHWTQPVERRRHQLLRTAAGGLWLLCAAAAGGIVAWIVGAVLQGGMAAGPLEVFPAAVGSMALLYLLGSIPTLLSDHPVWWIVGVYAGFGLLTAVAHTAGWPIVEPLQAAFGFDRWGLGRAAAAPTILGGGSIAPAPPGSGGAWGALGLSLAAAAAGLTAAASIHQDRSGST